MKKLMTIAAALMLSFGIIATSTAPAEAGKREKRIAAGVALGVLGAAIILNETRGNRRHYGKRYYGHRHYGKRRYYNKRRYHRNRHYGKRHYRHHRKHRSYGHYQNRDGGYCYRGSCYASGR